MVAGVMRGGEIVREDAGLSWAGDQADPYLRVWSVHSVRTHYQDIHTRGSTSR